MEMYWEAELWLRFLFLESTPRIFSVTSIFKRFDISGIDNYSRSFTFSKKAFHRYH